MPLTLAQVKLAAENDQQYPSHAVTALRQGSFSKFPEIVAFGKKLSHSLQAAQVLHSSDVCSAPLASLACRRCRSSAGGAPLPKNAAEAHQLRTAARPWVPRGVMFPPVNF